VSVDQEHYRHAMSRLATGVTVVTTRGHDRHELMTANAVMSVSLTPTLLAVGVAEGARWLPAVLDCGRFAVNVLSDEHEELARWCADRARHDRPGDLLGHDARLSSTGLLLLSDALAAIECTLYDQHLAGDHRLVIGEVDRVERPVAAGKPLVFHDRTFTTTRAAAPVLRQVAGRVAAS